MGAQKVARSVMHMCSLREAAAKWRLKLSGNCSGCLENQKFLCVVRDRRESCLVVGSQTPRDGAVAERKVAL